MKPPPFENTQIAIDKAGKIIRYQDSLGDWLGLREGEGKGQKLRSLLLEREPGWKDTLPSRFHSREFTCFLPLFSEGIATASGIQVNCVPYDDFSSVVMSPSLSPHESLKKAFVGDIPNDPRTFSAIFLRLQKAEARLADYLVNFPGIFFTQRPDLSFSYLSKGIQNLFPNDHEGFLRNGGLFLNFIFEQDREYYLKRLNEHSERPETFSFIYRIKIPPIGQTIYLMDIRTPSITANGKLLSYDGVFLDVTRQSIAEHRLSHSVWREGLATLTNGLVHDFSNLMAGIFSISELYHGMLEKDDPMANGMGQIKKSAMQAQKLVRRIIDLHRETATPRAVHDLRLLLKDQMDLVGIIIPRSARVVTDFGSETLPAYLEETGFRQVILNLAINARDAIGRTGRLKISLRRVKRGEKIMDGAYGESRKAPALGAEIALKDDGEGIPEELFDKILDPFFTTKESDSGSGFGLYNAKLYVEDHKGLIGFRSIIGSGTTFYIFLPLIEDENASESSRKRAARRATREFVKPRKRKG